VIFLAYVLNRTRSGEAVGRLVAILTTLVIVELVAGAINVALLAPVWMQLLHLLLACLVWISLFLLGTAAFGVAAPEDATTGVPAGVPVS